MGLRGGHQPVGLGQNTIIWQDFCQKLHEDERNWTQGRGASIAPLGTANGCLAIISVFCFMFNYIVNKEEMAPQRLI